MLSTLRSKFWHIIAFLCVAGLYLILASSRAAETAIDGLIDNAYQITNSIVLVALIIMSTAILLINLYSYAIFREVRYLVFTILGTLLGASYIVQLLAAVDINILTPAGHSTSQQLSLLLALAILVLLLGKLVLVRRAVGAKLQQIRLPFALIAVFVLLFAYLGIRSNVDMNNQWVLGGLFLLIFANIIGYLIRYIAEDDPNAKTLLFVGIIHLATFVYPPLGDEGSDYVMLMTNLFRLVSLVFMSHNFFTTMFSSYVGKLMQLDTERTAYLTDLERLIEERTKSLQEANDTLEAEIDSAKQLQKSMMPVGEISYPGVSFVSDNIPCDKMSGDFFDIYDIDENRVGMYILDVSGHGINAALMNIYCYHYIRSTSPLVKRFLGDKPSRNLLHLYEEFNKMGFPDEMHMVLMIAAYDRQSKRLTYSSGGLNCEPILVRRSGDIIRLNHSSGFPITKMGSVFTPDYIDAKIHLSVGDRVIFYTDGLVDKRQPFRMSEEDVMQRMLEYIDKPLGELQQVITREIDPYRNRLVDDISFFIMEVGN